MNDDELGLWASAGRAASLIFLDKKVVPEESLEGKPC